MPRKQPETSRDAYLALTPEKLKTDYGKILGALKVLGTGTYEEIANYIQCREPNVVSRRLKEMEGLELIWKPGEKRPTNRGRTAYVYQITSDFKTEKSKKEALSTQQSKTTEIVTKPKYIEQQLF